MPVSTFSSGNAALRSHGGRSAVIARWNSTRARIVEDDRQVSNGGINEMDGTGLYERPNWPLSDMTEERNVSPESPEDEEERRMRREELEQVDQQAVMRRTEDIETQAEGIDYQVHDDVSDIDEEVDREWSDERVTRRGSEDRQQNLARAQEEFPNPALLPEPQGDGETTTKDSQLAHAQIQENKSSELHANLGQPPSDVSPVREQVSPSFSSAGRRERYASIDSQSSSVGPEHSHIGARQSEDEGDRASQDVATSTPFGTDEHSRTSDEPATPEMNGTTPWQMTGHVRGSSMTKSTPLSRSNSRLSNYQTTHIPHNKDRVRYSWQSLQGDEPNRPRIHVIKLVSEVATAAAGFPGGEAFGFSISPGGRRIAAYNSTRLYVLQTAALPVGISQDYALKRRPLAVEIVDDGDVLAILADEHTVNVYDLRHQRLQRTRTIKLDFPTNCIALAPMGGLLAVAYEGGVEIFSLDASALPTDRRAVRSQRMDKLAFSEDGSTLLGTTTRINTSSTVVVSVPIFPAAMNGVPSHEELKEAWCSELLHPENIRNSSHATFMREDGTSCNDRVFAWNGLADTFGILNVSDLQYGNIDFPIVISPPLSKCGGLGAAMHSPPAIDEHGDTVAMIVNDRTIRLYIVPHTIDDNETTVEAHSIDHELDEGYGCPFSEVRWVYSSSSLPAPLNNQTQVRGRLIVTSPGGVVQQGIGEEYVDDIEGGRIILFDFDPQFAGHPGQTFNLTLGKSPPQMLVEEEAGVEDQVALVRRRTVNQSKNGGLSQRPITLGRAATTINRERALRSASPSLGLGSGRRSVTSIHSAQSDVARSLPDLMETNETSDALEEPYVQGAPRSVASLQRAASNVQRHRFQTLEERNQERVSVDSNRNFLPLPEYTEEPNAPLPSRFRAMAGLDAHPQPPPKPAIVTASNGMAVGLDSPGPATAPASTAEAFDSDQRFRAAQNAINEHNRHRQDAVAAAMQSPTTAIPGSGAFSSIASMPRSLQRAYSNAASPLGSGQPPSLIGDWENVSPRGTLRPVTFNSGTGLNQPTEAGESFSEGEPTSIGNSPELTTLDRTRSAASSNTTAIFRSPSSEGGIGVLPPMQAFRNAATANATTASLFPPTQAHDHVPFRSPPVKAGSVTHPITAWRPPTSSIGQKTISTSGSRGHSRKSSLASRSAFATTPKAKNLGFFKKKTPRFVSGSYPRRHMDADTSIMETKSMITLGTKRENRCAVM
ncbi:hypothetical protein M433DRAFT_153031 [Acidomyces richmondensis BFW]|nr:MAG: hypothetical protein FE78DRAFT_86265 [Acidomyces sp. 'richmondensis']KYG46731.1 hypothetical protein M433DRAFT_153031 [Acidomyces richmondensis BFW]